MKSLLLCICFLRASLGCSLLRTINNSVSLLLDGAGFHRNYLLNVSISAEHRFLNCAVTYKIRIPSGAFLDMDTLLQENREETIISRAKFNVEKPQDKSADIVVYICSKKPLVNSFLFSDSIDFLVHLRYHKSSIQSSSATVGFPVPDILMHCEMDEIPVRECERHVEQGPCECLDFSDTCSYLNLGSGKQSRQVVRVPIGDKNWVNIVLVGTVVAIFAFLLQLVIQTLTLK